LLHDLRKGLAISWGSGIGAFGAVSVDVAMTPREVFNLPA
jgi:hypothetical protein